MAKVAIGGCNGLGSMGKKETTIRKKEGSLGAALAAQGVSLA